MILSAVAHGAVLQIGAPTVEEPRVTFPIALEGDVGSGVAALDFRFEYDPRAFKPLAVEPGLAATDADKALQWNVRRPGECIVVMMGMNQTPCLPGELARFALQIRGEPGDDVYAFAVTRPTLSAVSGKAISATGSTWTLTFADSSGVSGDDGEEPDDTAGVEPSGPDADADQDSSYGAGDGPGGAPNPVAAPLARVWPGATPLTPADENSDGTRIAASAPRTTKRKPTHDGLAEQLDVVDALRAGIATPVGLSSGPLEDGAGESREAIAETADLTKPEPIRVATAPPVIRRVAAVEETMASGVASARPAAVVVVSEEVAPHPRWPWLTLGIASAFVVAGIAVVCVRRRS